MYDSGYYQRIEAERRSEKCRTCRHFDPSFLTCLARSGWKLAKHERLVGCPNFKADIWGGRA